MYVDIYPTRWKTGLLIYFINGVNGRNILSKLIIKKHVIEINFSSIRWPSILIFEQIYIESI